jgi:hypothetical protein
VLTFLLSQSGGIVASAWAQIIAGIGASTITLAALLAGEYRARFETEIPDGAFPSQKTDWYDRARSFYRVPAVLVTIGILIGASAILQRAQLSHDTPDERSTLKAVETDRPDDSVPTDERDTTGEEVAFVNPAAGETGAQSLRLEIRLHGPSWVSAVADGERVVYRLMQPGERTLVEARGVITLRVGDAGAVAYSINGATGRPLGRNGEAVTVRITNENIGSLLAEPAGAVPPKVRPRESGLDLSAAVLN